MSPATAASLQRTKKKRCGGCAYRAVIDDFIASGSGRIFNTAGDAVLARIR